MWRASWQALDMHSYKVIFSCGGINSSIPTGIKLVAKLTCFFFVKPYFEARSGAFVYLRHSS